MARAIDPEIKALAIADLLDGDQPAIVAARYDLPGGTVRQWKNRLVTPDVTTGVTTAVTESVTGTRRPTLELQQMELGELVMANLRAKIIATQRIAEHAATTTWLNNQTAADLAQLFTAIDHAATNILDRMASRANADDADGTA